LLFLFFPIKVIKDKTFKEAELLGKRIERIYRFLLENAENGLNKMGTTTSEVADQLTIQRSNASKDLNQLVKEGRVQKSETRPVRYWVSQYVQPTQEKYVPSYKENRPQKEKAMPQRVDIKIGNRDIFSTIIGVNGSMKNAVEQAKAAILYPPRGLNCLITGPTGSGKTYFAHAMFQFAKSNQVIEEGKELIVFNCADYANNPELLMSHLFGYVRGAFTGADQEKSGLIDQADGSMLFLDEIHRLPPEGQEMIFYFMDHGTFSRLGETGKNHQANVRIVGATTEDPNSTLLDTFTRRIPINIQLPFFEKRPATEKVDLVRVLVGQEATRIQRTITLTEDVVKALIGSVSFGNIGQLKSNVQLVCARGFLNHMQQEEIEIDLDELPEGIRSGLMILGNRRDELAELSKILEPTVRVQPNQNPNAIQSDSYELPYNLYDIIGDKAALLKADGLDQEAINHFISTDINVHLKSFYKDHGFSFNSENKLSEFVDQKVITVTNRIYDIVRTRLNYDFQQNFVYAMSLHISSFLKKIHLGEERHTNDNIRQMVADYPKEFEVAKEIRSFIGESFKVAIPESEAYYLAVLLVSLRTAHSSGKIGVVVAAHGNSTASSMVQVVQQLLEVDQVAAVDMPLDMPPSVALKKIEESVRTVNDGSGVILLVDMGSLATFNNEIQRETGVIVRTVDMVTTSVVLETVRKASVIGTDIDSLYESLRKFRGYGSVEHTEENKNHHRKAILAICASGKGTAQRIKELIQNSLSKRQNQNVEVVTLSVADLKTELVPIQRQYQLIAATGIVDPKIDAPFISLERFIDQDVDQLLEEILLENDLSFEQDVDLGEEQAEEICVKYMEQNLTFVNPRKVIAPLWQFGQQLINDLELVDALPGFQINFVLHSAGMIERIILRQPLSVAEELLSQLKHEAIYKQLHIHVRSFSRLLNIEIPETEEYYLAELIKNHQEKTVLADN
jgi:transcriptional regulatory protein LevR/transcriptional regulator with AAA-type ATPase domain